MNFSFYLKLFIFGLVSSLAFAPFYFVPIFFISLPFLLKTLENSNNLKNSFFIGWLFGFGYFIGNCYWYCNSLLVEPLKYAWLIPFAISIIPAYLACYIGMTTFITKYSINKLSLENKFLITIIFSISWFLFEYLRSIILTGFPWNLICYCLGFSSLLIQPVSLFGCHIFSFIILTIFTSIYYLIDKKYKLYAIYPLIIVLFIISFSFIRLNKDVKYSSYKIRLVQPNISFNDREIYTEDDILNKLLTLSLANIDDINYIFWPEATLPHYILTQHHNNVLDYLNSRLIGKTLITGGIRIDESKNKIYNSVFIIKNGNIIDYYDKYNLVPFGEFIPFRNIFPFINSLATNLDLNRAEQRRKKIIIDDIFPVFSPNICYESIFTSSINKQSKLIINFTNDFWFGNSSGPYQHLEALRFRAVENNIPAVRIANSGITAIIDNYGRIINKTKLNEEIVIDVSIPIIN